MSSQEIDNYIQTTQPYDNEQDEINIAKQTQATPKPGHTIAKQTHQGIIQKQISKQKNPVPPQFLKKNNPLPSKTKVIPKNQTTKPHMGPRAVSTKQKNKRQWKNSYQITQISSLVQLKQEQSATKRFKIQFAYYDSQTKKTHNATLRFGKRTANYVIDGVRDHSNALLKQAQIRKAEDPFQPNYWCLWLLNNPQCLTLQEALAYFRKHNNIY